MRAGYLKPVGSPDFVPSEVDLLKLAAFPNLSMDLEFVCSVPAVLPASMECGCQSQFLLMAYVGSFITMNHISVSLFK